MRIILGIIALIIGLTGSFDGVWKWVLMIVTSSIQFCGLYAIFGINTCKVKGKK